MLEWWSGLRPAARYGIAISLLTISTALFLCGWLWIWGWAVGGVLLCVAGPSRSEKNGY